ncbi:MAG TPA: hypothetical protein VKY92_09180 [Verrucomicrobiae bacterium]|nr:hypothetical protein [Verrucomicrobiae bacterium]
MQLKPQPKPAPSHDANALVIRAIYGGRTANVMWRLACGWGAEFN